MVAGFGAHGKNYSPEPINDFDAYLRSDITNETIPIYLLAVDASIANACTPQVPTLPKDTSGIPAFADFDIVSYRKPFMMNVIGDDAVTLTNFLNTFVPFTIVLKYNGKSYQRQFSRAEIDRQVAMLEKVAAPITIPHVIRKPSAPSVPLPPLVTRRPSASDSDVTGKIPEK
jgi:hypothetical protein